MNIVKRKHIVVFIDFFRRYFAAHDFAEDAVGVGAHESRTVRAGLTALG
jgi:hypothetical protein